MHPSALKNAALFFDTYAPAFESGQVVEIGSQDVNGGLRSICPEKLSYTGLDFVSGAGVDIVLNDPYLLPLSDGSADIVVSSSCFEHSQMFWLLFLEVQRILKPNGLFYLNAPSNGTFHRYPVDCWRFYPDSGGALVEWGRRSGYSVRLLESFISAQGKDPIHDYWNDFVAVFLKDERHAGQHLNRILNKHPSFTNGLVDEDKGFRNFVEQTEDQRLAIAGRKRRLKPRWLGMR